MSHILVTGGAGFIGSHTSVALLAAGHSVSIIDDFSNSHPEVLRRIEQLGKKSVYFVKGDARNRALLREIFDCQKIDGVIHFAGLKSVGESVKDPLRYYDCNIGSTLALCEVMAAAGIFTLIFSSSATVYGDPLSVPIDENFPRAATNPYGASKLMIEDMLADLTKADERWNIARLRYFNPVGAHASGLIGEAPSGIPNNLMPYVAQVASGQRECLQVFGSDYPTPDGTGVRDYIHVLDLAEGHLAALQYLLRKGGLLTVNLGTGCGYSVLDMVKAFESASGKKVPYTLTARRAGDIATCYANPGLAKKLLNWEARHGIDAMCRDAWRWQCAQDARQQKEADAKTQSSGRL